MTISLIRLWTGAEVRALREARRMSLIDFAGHLGVSVRIVSTWEADGTSITPRPANQEALDTSLSRLTPAEQARFVQSVPPDAIGEAVDNEQLVRPDRIRHNVDGRSMTWIPAGVFLSGSLDQQVWLAGFHIDTYPVTNSDFKNFVDAVGYPPPRHWNGNNPPTELSDHPVVWVTHDDADAYASWAHKSLPSSQQWEKAARGIAGGTWPWGNQATAAKCNCKLRDRIGATTPVDRYKSGASPFGVYDLAGNVWEWLSTPSGPNRFELKGSSFNSLLESAAGAAFNDAHHLMRDDDTGFRCVAAEFGEAR